MLSRFAPARVLAACAAGLALAAGASAQVQAPPSFELDVVQDTGLVRNRGANRDVVASFPVHVAGAEWLQLRFDEIVLAGDLFEGTHSMLRITSHLDGGVQELNRFHVEQWRRESAYFNGDTVQVEIVADPGTGANRARLVSVVAGLPPTPEESQCGPNDDRAASNDPRAARILPVGCTGWLIDDCQRCMLSAGHCSGSGLATIQFNVPLSNANGSLNNPSPDDQYAVDVSSKQLVNGGVGNDWGYYGVFPNSNTGLTPAEAQGQTYQVMSPPPFVSGDPIRITGYGVDGGTANQTQQTHVGPWVTSGAALTYMTDTEGGNSGSPVIHDNSGAAIGIHTHGGCSGTQGNAGTAFSNAGLQGALAAPRGVCRAGMRLLSEAPTILAPGSSTTIDLALDGTATPGSELLHLRYDGGATLDLPLMNAGGGMYRATLPPPVCGATPEYWFSAEVPACGGVLTLPANAPATTFSATVGSQVVAFEDDVETDLGWTFGHPGDTATTGQWEVGDPVGTAYQPEDDHTNPGVRCFFTGQGSPGGADGVNDIDGGRTSLYSPIFDLSSASDPFVSYWRWFNRSNADGDFYRVALSNDGGSTFMVVDAQVGGAGSVGGWIQNTLRVADFMAPTASMQLRVRAADIDGGSFVEGAFDDLEVYDLPCDANLADCNGNRIVDSDDIASGRSQDTDGNGIPDECGAVGTPYCFCSSGAPCGNTDAGAGCVNSSGAGAVAFGSGSSSVSADDLLVSIANVPTNKNGILFMGGSQIQAPFGDGQRCAGDSGSGVYRFPLQNSGASGQLDLGPGLAAFTASQFPAAGQIQSGQTWNFQAWFRDPMGPCGNGSNTSNGLSVTFTP